MPRLTVFPCPALPPQTVPDQATFTALQNAWRGADVSTAGAITRSNGTWGLAGAPGGRRRSLLQSGGGQETRLPASAVGTWTNCSATCTYEVRPQAQQAAALASPLLGGTAQRRCP